MSIQKGTLASVQVTMNRQWCGDCGSDQTAHGECMECHGDDVGVPLELAQRINSLAENFRDTLESTIKEYITSSQ